MIKVALANQQQIFLCTQNISKLIRKISGCKRDIYATSNSSRPSSSNNNNKMSIYKAHNVELRDRMLAPNLIGLGLGLRPKTNPKPNPNPNRSSKIRRL